MAFQGDSIYWVEVEKVVPNPFQPRREFDQHKLKELGDSIRMYGVLQPLTVTRNEVQRDDGTFYTEYELIAGERRLRASKLAGVAQVPVIIREGEQSEQEKLELAIIENLQREDLNAVDRAIAFKQLAETFGLSHSQVAEKVGRSREYVSNSIRLLGLPEHMLESLKHGDMMEGHARTLLMLTDRPEEQEVVYREILLKKLSVREVERIVRKIATEKVRKKNAKDLDSHLIEFEKKFTETLGTRVQIQKTDFGGKLTIDYFSEDDLSVILERIKEENQEQQVTKQEEVNKIAAHTPLDMVTEEISATPEPVSEIPPAPQPFVAQAQTTEPVHQTEEVKPSLTSEYSFHPTQQREINNPVETEPEVVEPEGAFSHFVTPQKEEVSVPESTRDTTEELVPEVRENISDHTQQEASQNFAKPEPVVEHQSSYVESSVKETPQSQQTEEVIEKEENKQDSDDSNLYSINSFSV